MRDDRHGWRSAARGPGRRVAASSGSTAAAPDTTPRARPCRADLRRAQRFKRGKAPRTLSGSVAVDASGLKDVLLRITRRSGKRCETYDGGQRALGASRAAAGPRAGSSSRSATAPTGPTCCPGRSAAGRYVLDIRTVDGAGNVTRGADRGERSLQAADARRLHGRLNRCAARPGLRARRRARAQRGRGRVRPGPGRQLERRRADADRHAGLRHDARARAHAEEGSPTPRP